MARDFTKYTVEGLGENLNKRQLVFTIVKDWTSKNNPSLEEIQAVFPDEPPAVCERRVTRLLAQDQDHSV